MVNRVPVRDRSAENATICYLDLIADGWETPAT